MANLKDCFGGYGHSDSMAGRRRLPPAADPAPQTQDGTKRHIGPEETVWKTKRPEVFSAVGKLGQSATPGCMGQNQPMVASEAEQLGESGQPAARAGVPCIHEGAQRDLDQGGRHAFPWL